MTTPAWTLRPATAADRDALFELHRATMGPYVDAVWGWDDDEQAGYFDATFRPGVWQIVRVEGEDAGVLVVERRPDAIDVASIQIRPGLQGRGLATAILRSLMDEAAATARPLTLRVLRVNTRARRLYDRLGFEPVAEDELRTWLRWTPPAG